MCSSQRLPHRTPAIWAGKTQTGAPGGVGPSGISLHVVSARGGLRGDGLPTGWLTAPRARAQENLGGTICPFLISLSNHRPFLSRHSVPRGPPRFKVRRQRLHLLMRGMLRIHGHVLKPPTSWVGGTPGGGGGEGRWRRLPRDSMSACLNPEAGGVSPVNRAYAREQSHSLPLPAEAGHPPFRPHPPGLLGPRAHSLC